MTLVALPCLLGEPQLPFCQCQVPLHVTIHDAALGRLAVLDQPVTKQIQRLLRLALIVQYMSVTVDYVGGLRPLLERSLDKFATTVLVTSLTGCEPQARQIGPIVTQTGIGRFHDVQNALELARTSIEDQIAAELRGDQQVAGMGSNIGLGRREVAIRVFKQRKERRNMCTLPGQRGFCCQSCALFEEIGVR